MPGLVLVGYHEPTQNGVVVHITHCRCFDERHRLHHFPELE